MKNENFANTTTCTRLKPLTKEEFKKAVDLLITEIKEREEKEKLFKKTSIIPLSLIYPFLPIKFNSGDFNGYSQ